jgi:hypothetical protein
MVKWLSLGRRTEEPQAIPQTNINIPSSAVPMGQNTGLPELSVIQYVAKNESLDKELIKKYAGFNIEQISFANLSEKDKRYIMDELDIYQMTQQNFSFKVPMFRPDLDEQRKEISQYAISVLVAASKAEDGDLMHRALSSYSVNDTSIRTGQTAEKKPEKRSGLGAAFLGRFKR